MSKKLVSFKAKGKNVRFYAKNPGAGWHAREGDKYSRELDFRDDVKSPEYKRIKDLAGLNYRYSDESSKQGIPNPISNSSWLPMILVIGGIGLIWWLSKRN